MGKQASLSKKEKAGRFKKQKHWKLSPERRSITMSHKAMAGNTVWQTVCLCGEGQMTEVDTGWITATGYNLEQVCGLGKDGRHMVARWKIAGGMWEMHSLEDVNRCWRLKLREWDARKVTNSREHKHNVLVCTETQPAFKNKDIHK